MIRAYIGLLGEGKNFSMVADAIDQIKKGRRVISNFPINFRYWKKSYSSIYKAGKDFEDSFLSEENALFLIDEAPIVLPNYYWNKLPGEFLLKFAQSRKYGLDIFYTSQGFTHTVKRLRDITNEVVRCERRKVLGMQMFSNIVYNPDYFEGRIMPSIEIEKRFIIRRKIVNIFDTAWIFKAYDTFYKVRHSALLDIDTSKLEKPVLDTLQTLTVGGGSGNPKDDATPPTNKSAFEEYIVNNY